MNDTLGNNILRLRKEQGMTQEQLAARLGISYQAVSKWENALSSPDISALPLLADIFDVSIDDLFGREKPSVPQHVHQTYDGFMPWPDDGCLYAVLYRGHEYIGSGNVDGNEKMRVEFSYEGPALNIKSDFSVICGNVEGSVSAGGNVNCDNIGGNLTAGANVYCDNVYGDVQTDSNVNCDDVCGNVTAGSSVNCSTIEGDVYAFKVECDEINGSVNK